jgi:hypothetical protein
MSLPDLPVVGECEWPGVGSWYLRAGGPAGDYWTLLETVHADGHRDEGGMGGPALYPGRLVNVYTGRSDRGYLRVVVRADQRAQRIRFTSERGELCESHAMAEDPEVGVTLFAELLPWKTGVATLQALDADGQVLAEDEPRSP